MVSVREGRLLVREVLPTRTTKEERRIGAEPSGAAKKR